MGSTPQPIPIYSVGHSTRAIDDFARILHAHGVQQLVDIRTIPRSRHNPQFNRETLLASLRTAGIEYCHMPGLGGMRKPLSDSINTAWRNAAFRGYADYMQSAEFHRSLDTLVEISWLKPTAIMCAEAVPWRCHRSLLGDALVARGIDVIEILSETKAQPHSLTPFARVEGHRVIYPGARRTGNLELNFDAPSGN